MLRATGCPGATPGESVPTKDAPQFRSGRVTHPIGHDTGWTTARSQDEVGTNSAQERQYSPVMAALFSPRPPREKIVRVMSAGAFNRSPRESEGCRLIKCNGRTVG